MSNTNMHYYLIIPVLLFPLFASLAYAEGAKEERGRATEQTQHPPHDHHQTDHIKKLDEGLRGRRKRVNIN